MKYEAPRWLPGGHAQTIWPALLARRTQGPPPRWRRERWQAPDGDFVDVDFLAQAPQPRAGAAAAPLLVLFHGLEGSSRSHYAQAFAQAARERGWQLAVPHFRGCSGEINRAPRAYHSGDHAEIAWLLTRCAQRQTPLGGGPRAPLLAVGVSLGGNALARWAGEWGQSAGACVDALASVCAPLDLTTAGHAISRGFNRQVYGRMFLRTMVPKALAKLAQHPGLFDRAALLAARDLHAFDHAFTAPLHGFQGADDYWRRASALPLLPAVRVPALLVNAHNDPFVPAHSLPQAAQVSPQVTLWQPAHGGHVGFAQGAVPPGHVLWLPRAVCGWLSQQAGLPLQ